MKQIYGLLSLILTLGIVVLIKGSAHAATINIVAGTDAIEENSQCQLSEAIQNINDQAQTNADCIAGDGNDDTINLPSGTITLSGDLPIIARSTTIVGTGMSNTTINGISAYSPFSCMSTLTMTIKEITITAYKTSGISGTNCSVDIENVEIDGADSIDGNSIPVKFGMLFNSFDGNQHNFSISNTYIHNIISNSSDIQASGIYFNGGESSTVDFSINNVTIDTIASNVNAFSGGISILTGLAFNSTPATVMGTIHNTSISNITSVGGQGNGLSISNIVGVATSIVDVSIENTTFHNIMGSNSGIAPSAVIGLFGVGLQPTGAAQTNVTITNSIVYADNAIPNCDQSNLNNNFNGQGTVTNTLSSLGGNISDDNTCGDSFTDPTDQNNVDAADLHLGTLGDYGGAVPTIPLESGSIAIDAGVTVPGLTTDARGVSRPQCSAYDAGAYEYNGTCPTPSSPPLTGTTSNSTPISLVLPGSATNAQLIPIASNTIPTDPSFTYPSGLTSFQFDTEQGATETITLYFDLPGDPNDYLARKYNTTTKAFTTIQGATITRATYNNQSMLKLTYNITDGGDLDQDGQVNGTIVDPVGLAQTKTTAPNTGVPTYWLMGVKG